MIGGAVLKAGDLLADEGGDPLDPASASLEAGTAVQGLEEQSAVPHSNQ